MKIVLALVIAILTIEFITIQGVRAEVWIPDNEFDSYFDQNGIYTIIGAVKSTETYPVIPTITLSIQDDDKKIIESFVLPVANPIKDIPFKIRFDDIQGKNPILEKPEISFVPGPEDYSNIEVEYDSTLVKFPDGHTSGFIINNGNSTAYGIKVYALMHDKENKVIDTGKSIEKIEKMAPGEKTEFTIYPDPSKSSKVSYYSCFAIGDDLVVPTYVMRDGKRFDFRYETEGYLTNIQFDNASNSLKFQVHNPWPMKSFANIEFPMESNSQQFEVYQEKIPIYFIQSNDEDKNWHLAFNLEPQSSKQITISGFDYQVTNIVSSKVTSQTTENENFNPIYFLIILPIGAIIAGIIFKKKMNLKIAK